MKSFERLTWEILERQVNSDTNNRDQQYVAYTERARVFGGWLVRYRSSLIERGRDANSISIGVGSAGGITFVPDEKGQWDP